MPWNDNSDGGSKPTASNNSPWGSGGSGGGGGNGGSPWNRPGGSGGGQGGGGGGPDLEEQMRRMQERFSRRGKGGGKGPKGPSFGPGGFLALGAVALIAWLATGIVVVDEGERAAVFRFGEYQKNFAPGFHIHLPTPIETHEILPSERQQETQIGVSNQDESLMLTGDENIVDVQFRVFWFYDGENPEDFILNIDDGRPLVKAAAESVMREVVGKSTLDAVITTGRGEIASTVREQLQVLLNDYGAGVTVENVEIQDARNPGPVRDAFIDVINAGQDAERMVQEAIRYANDIVPRARGEAQQILQNAQAYRDQVIADATGQADRFTLILREYQRAPQVTRERMYLETMEKVLNRTDKLILDSDSGAVPYLPLDRVNRSGGN
ncbi:FtsH protease activity modulator HflK [Hyphomonas sp. FCG-A18]|jgi:membrane protease subunit HflK|uniref:FtsH protease activity modulator HflK n=1 Tax=Hyphomonas sp. FCG-A18 TaxID=3080019 RepID=UPI002B29E765|nr:FtsH protease activity modulator HflK [Hyphomonas sp. FCG-A18]